MGIHGLFAQIGAGQRISLAKLSSDHYARHERPLRLAIDISIWLFQIQSGKGGSNPALRTFYYRLLRLLTLNIWPLFVFDGPNKPLFKRNKKVGGPGVRIANVPEFLAKQLLKQFGFPWHVAPGEAEAECALLQREGVVDAVLSEDVDTLMFGSGVTLRNWTAENSSKTPTHVNVYRAEETEQRSGLRPDGMVLVALMSGGDYLPEGIPGCGPKLACDAARAGFGRELCALSRRDAAGLRTWRDRLQHEIRTNESKYFTRRNTNLTIPEDFPNLEVLGYYTHPCVSTPEKLARLRQELSWDQTIDFPALRTFTAEAFDWRCLGGAKKFIKNLAPALLVRQLRLRADSMEQRDPETQEQHEKELVTAIHGKRNHSITDGELEYRITFIPGKLVSIDLSIEEEDDEIVPAGGNADDSEAESEFMLLPSSTQHSEAPLSPTKKRNFKPFEPDQPEKLWMLKSFLQVGCPLLVEDYEASFKDPKEFFKGRRKAKTAAAPKSKRAAKGGSATQENTLLAYAKVTKPGTESHFCHGMQSLTSSQTNSRSKTQQDSATTSTDGQDPARTAPAFRLPATQVSPRLEQRSFRGSALPADVLDISKDPPRRPQRSAQASNGFAPNRFSTTQIQKTPKHNRKRPSPDLPSPALSQRTITTFYSPSPRKARANSDVIDLVSSSPVRPVSPTPRSARFECRPDADDTVAKSAAIELAESVTKRRRKDPLRRWQTEPVLGTSAAEMDSDDELPPLKLTFDNNARSVTNSIFMAKKVNDDVDATPKASRETVNAFSTIVPPLRTQSKSNETSIVSACSDGVNEVQDVITAPPKLASGKPRNKHASSNGSTLPQSPPPINLTDNQLPRRSPRQQTAKKRIELRESLEGWWKEVDAEAVDMSGDGSGWKKSGGKARLVATSSSTRAWRKSQVEVLDLSGA